MTHIRLITSLLSRPPSRSRSGSRARSLQDTGFDRLGYTTVHAIPFIPQSEIFRYADTEALLTAKTIWGRCFMARGQSRYCSGSVAACKDEEGYRNDVPYTANVTVDRGAHYQRNFTNDVSGRPRANVSGERSSSTISSQIG
jgi:hypothetical protein